MPRLHGSHNNSRLADCWVAGSASRFFVADKTPATERQVGCSHKAVAMPMSDKHLWD